MAKRGRKEKVTPFQVLGEVRRHHRITKAQLAETFDVCPETISSKARRLRKDGEPIIFDGDGYFIFDRIRNDQGLESIKQYMEWTVNTLSGVADCGRPIKSILMDSREYLSHKLSSTQRRSLGQFCGFIKGIVDHIEIQNELED